MFYIIHILYIPNMVADKISQIYNSTEKKTQKLLYRYYFILKLIRNLIFIPTPC